MNEIQLVITEQAYKILENRPPRRSFFLKILKKILKFLEKYFGEPILIKMPTELSEIEGGTYEIINIAYELQKSGIINSIKKRVNYPDEPRIYCYNAPSSGKSYGSGVDFLSKEKALWKSLGEATERYLWFNSDWFFQGHKIRSYKEMGRRALNIFSLAGFSEEQKNKYPILQYDENTVFGWIPARSLVSKKNFFCPIQLVSSYYFKQKTEPMLRWCITTGLATGPSLEEAVVKGILEVVERDAFMISYLNKLSPPIIDLEHLSSQDEEIAKIIKNFKRYNLEVYVLHLPTDFPVYVNLAIIIDRTSLGPALSVGASADFDFKTAFLDALSESLIVRYSLKNKFKQEINLEKIGHEERIIYWGKIENLPKMEFFLKGESVIIDLSQNFYKVENNKNYYKEKLKILSEEFEKKNYEACYAELTTKEIKKLGFRCVQAVIPELQPLHLDEVIPYFGGKRLREIPLKFGYQPAEVLNQEPHPFP
ncbi:MAG: YcaO-like family protein [bacterium]|nr:YcaO-like family protein [bacterium]